MQAALRRPLSIDGKLFYSNAATIVILHLLALPALSPALFSWTGVALVFLGSYVFGGLGINIGYHRLLTHRGFRCPKWLERTFAVLGVCSLQDSPTRWVAVHRMHHQHADKPLDPHSPTVSFFWGYIGWLLFKNRQIRKRSTLDRYAKDIMHDPFYMWLYRHRMWLFVYVAHAVLFLALGCLAGWLTTRNAAAAFQFGLSVLVWGVFVRTVYFWQVTWVAQGATHSWGYRNYETGDNSRNNWIMALFTYGEGWHNNHHAQPRSACNHHRWWEIDLMYATILLLRAVGLVTEIQTRHGRVRSMSPTLDSAEGTRHRADAPEAFPPPPLHLARPQSRPCRPPLGTLSSRPMRGSCCGPVPKERR